MVATRGGSAYRMGRQAGCKKVRERVDARAADPAPTAKRLQVGGIHTLRAIAAGLNDRRVRTPRGVGQ